MLTPEEADEYCETLLAKIDELPERAADFGDSVREKVEGIRETISERNEVTPGQASALENMSAGVERWLERS